MGVLFGCGQGVVFVPEIDSGKLAPMMLVHSDFLTCLNRAYLFRNSANLLFADQDNKIYNSS